MTIWDEMSEAERKQSLRAQGPSCAWAADALDAKDARIKELEGALREMLDAWDCEPVSTNRVVESRLRARSALNPEEGRG